MGLYDKLKDLNPTFQQSPAVTGPGGEQFAYRTPQLDEASARRMAEMMGGTVDTVRYNGGPFQASPQYQIRVPGAADGFDASLIWDDYLRSDATDFNARRQAEIDRSRMPVNDPSPGLGPGGGSGGGPSRGVVIPGAAVPGPTWPTPALPPRPDEPAVVPGGRGVASPGGSSPAWNFSGALPPPIELLPPTGLPRAHRRPNGLLTLVPPFAGGGLLQP